MAQTVLLLIYVEYSNIYLSLVVTSTQVQAPVSFELKRRCITSFAFANDAIFISLYKLHFTAISREVPRVLFSICSSLFIFLFCSSLSGSYRHCFFSFHTLTKFLPHFNAPQCLSPLCFHYSFQKVLHLEAGRGVEK